MLETAWESRWLPDKIKKEPGEPGSLGKSAQRRHNGGIAQLGEHLPCKQGVKGSNPFISTVAVSIRPHEGL